VSKDCRVFQEIYTSHEKQAPMLPVSYNSAISNK